jgi:hypothetical protein
MYLKALGAILVSFFATVYPSFSMDAEGGDPEIGRSSHQHSFVRYNTPDGSVAGPESLEVVVPVVKKPWYKRPANIAALALGAAGAAAVIWGIVRLATPHEPEGFPDEPELCKIFLNGTAPYLQKILSLWSPTDPASIRQYAGWFGWHPSVHLPNKACGLFMGGTPIDAMTNYETLQMDGGIWSCTPSNDGWRIFTCTE